MGRTTEVNRKVAGSPGSPHFLVFSDLVIYYLFYLSVF